MTLDPTSMKDDPMSSATNATVASHSGTWSTVDRTLPDERELPPGAWRNYEPLQLPPVLRHSLEAFAAQGYHGTSVREIAKRLGQTVPAIYYHYENKQALLVTLLQGSMEEVLQRCQLAVAESTEGPVERFSSLVACVVLYIGHRSELISLDAEMNSLDLENRRTYVALRDQLEAMVVAAVEDGIEEGTFTTAYPSDAARAVLTMCLGIANWYDPAGPLGPEDIAERYTQFALGIVGQRSRRRSRRSQ
jgi:AcrR family transcriptional regulator